MTHPPVQAGIGLRQPHYAALIEAPPALGFVEVHSENFFADGGATLSVLHQARERYPISLHGVGLALGSAAGVDPWHLDRLARLAERIEPVRVSDHACFARAPCEAGGPVVHASDLLPIAFTPASLDILVRNVSQVQDRLRRPIAVENLSAYLSFEDDAMPEPVFLAEMARRSGCTLLLDLNNLMVNAVNASRATCDDDADAEVSCCAFVDALPAGSVDEIHLAGYADVVSGDARERVAIAIDDHGSRVRPAVWRVYAHALRRLGPVPTLIEWDTDVPALELLLAEAAQADRIAATVRSCAPTPA